MGVMQYMGGKAKIARQIVSAIISDTPNRSVWYEPFVGGGNVMEVAAPYFGVCVGSDAHEDLILMWQHVTSGGVVPEFITREEYYKLKDSEPTWLRGFAGFGASFGGKWWGGYGVSPRDGEVCRASYRSVTRQGAIFRTNGVRFRIANFGDLKPPVGSVIYCDPPYAGATKYSESLDYPTFYRTLLQWSHKSSVYLSEYAIPENIPHRVVWQRTKRNVLEKSDNQRMASEFLFRIGDEE